MAQFPNTTAADGIWTLKKVRRAILGEYWPPLSLELTGTYSLDSAISNLEKISVNDVIYTGAGITQARVEEIFNSTNFQDTTISDLSRNDYELAFGSTSGESLTFSYSLNDASALKIRLQRSSSIDVDFTVGGDASITGTATPTSQVFTSSSIPASGTFTITTNNNSNGLVIQAIGFSNVTPGDLSYG